MKYYLIILYVFAVIICSQAAADSTEQINNAKINYKELYKSKGIINLIGINLIVAAPVLFGFGLLKHAAEDFSAKWDIFKANPSVLKPSRTGSTILYTSSILALTGGISCLVYYNLEIKKIKRQELGNISFNVSFSNESYRFCINKEF
jgi:hypothetical protein